MQPDSILQTLLRIEKIQQETLAEFKGAYAGNEAAFEMRPGFAEALKRIIADRLIFSDLKISEDLEKPEKKEPIWYDKQDTLLELKISERTLRRRKAEGSIASKKVRNKLYYDYNTFYPDEVPNES